MYGTHSPGCHDMVNGESLAEKYTERSSFRSYFARPVQRSSYARPLIHYASSRRQSCQPAELLSIIYTVAMMRIIIANYHSPQPLPPELRMVASV